MDKEILWDYRSPIEIIQAEVKREMEDNILKAVIEYDIKVDKGELIRALQYDRGQYQKGYDDAMRSIVRCSSCYYGIKRGCEVECIRFQDLMLPNGFCCYGERKDNERKAD